MARLDIQSAVDGIVKNNGSNCYEKLIMSPYHCEFCGAIHVGHTPKSVFDKIENEKIAEEEKRKRELIKEKDRQNFKNFCKRWSL